MAPVPAGSWERSIITEGHIEYLRRMRELLSGEVATRAPGEERVREPDPDERVIFGTHFLVGFRLPGTSFLWHFLEFYGLHMHHLGVNSVLYLMHRDMDYSYGGMMVYRRPGRPLLKMKWKESFKKWQRTFFPRSIGQGRDWVNLPPFSDKPPSGRNWDLDMRSEELAVIAGRMQELTA
ncbi:hypothetical protein D1007_37805 [Hordeum vulgare]|nr:hypothetical protein D1007_37805 [Hordeum vulgare]